ncbi:hypothetical protein A4A49_05392 [Nicotiana attenuata]|uniref:Uncharacterized protein n=1 Tax=Nicotiana attenuata TaxID=49451 RepID=A0A314KWT8_NICAT|nr:hypothetical protein A4A49_05392 [Nicotiana attenuata]
MEVTRHRHGRDPHDDQPTAASILRHRGPVEIGRFRGENPEAWIFQADRYFDFYHIAEDQRLSITSFYSLSP